MITRERELAVARQNFLLKASEFPVYPDMLDPHAEQIVHTKRLDQALVYEVAPAYERLKRQDQNLRFLALVLAQPSAGKDYAEREILNPFVNYYLQKQLVEYFDYSNLRVHRFDEKAQILRSCCDPAILTPKGKPLTHKELDITRWQLLADGWTDLKEGYPFHLWQAPAGTGLQYGIANQHWWISRPYADILPFELLNLAQEDNRELLDHTFMCIFTIMRGPWMDVWAWYRQLIKDAKTLDEANNINDSFNIFPFETEKDLSIRQIGGSLEQVEVSQQASWSTAQFAIHSLDNVPDFYLKPLEDDITETRFLLGADVILPHNDPYESRVRANLSLGSLYFHNHQSLLRNFAGKLPKSIMHINILNNPKMEFYSREQRLQARELIAAARHKYGIDYNSFYTMQ